jgi:hypothetical protein
MQRVDLDELQGAVDWISDGIVDNEAFVCRQNGKIYWISGDVDPDTEERPEDIDDPDKYVAVPNKYDLDIGVRLVFDFTKAHLSDCYHDVRSSFRRRGAYGRFKALLAKHNLLDTWYSYSEQRTLDVLEEWCETEGFEFERRDRSTV